jgi:hypothetical protein
MGLGDSREADSGREITRFHLDEEGEIVRTVAVHTPPPDSLGMHTVQPDGAGSAIFFIHQPYGPRQLIGHSPLGGWAEAVSSRYSIRWVGPEGRFEHLIVRDIVGPRLSDGEIETGAGSLRRQIEWLGVTSRSLPFGVPERKAPLRALIFDHSGRLWVQLSAPDGAMNRADIYERDGKWSGTVEWPSDVELRNGYVDSGTALGVSRDSLGVERVVRLRIRE